MQAVLFSKCNVEGVIRGNTQMNGERVRHHVTSIGQNNNSLGQQLMTVCFRKVCTFMSQQKS